MVFVNFTFFWETLTKPVGFADPSDCERSELLSEGDGARREVSAHLLRSSPLIAAQALRLRQRTIVRLDVFPATVGALSKGFERQARHSGSMQRG